MVTFGKAQLASVVATGVDFGATICVGSFLQGWYVATSVLGTVCGGMMHFYLGRNWVFGAQALRTGPQAARYGATWVGNLLLNAAGVYVMTHFLAVNYLAGKTIVSLLLGCSYNYFMQAHFVFKHL